MNQQQDIRWEQRFNNYKKALEKLGLAVSKIKKTDNEYDPFLAEIIREGLIQRFEYTHELACKVMKDFLIQAGNINIYGSKDATREAFSKDLIKDGEIWMDMINSRNKTSHTYNEKIADEIFSKIINDYYSEFVSFKDKMEAVAKLRKGNI